MNPPPRATSPAPGGNTPAVPPAMPADAGAVLADLQARLGHTFRDPVLLLTALTHPSWLQEHPETPENNQRLELLGDAVLQLLLTEKLFHLFPAEREGPLSKHRAVLSRGSFLAQLARETGLDAALRLGSSEEQTGGRQRDSTLEDAFEALFGALWLDAGLEPARRVLHAIYGPLEARLSSNAGADNPKGRLQERVQPEYGNNALRYETFHISGQDHAREYESRVYLCERFLATGRGTSKKHAEEAAAGAALALLARAEAEENQASSGPETP
ncbi:ribonuclease III [Opitutaceae bacterium TAV1]|nr:ribonuclease III [Opitutaceae bacterium TAV1]